MTSKGSPVSAFPAWPAGFGDEITPAGYAASRIEYQLNRDIERLAIKSVSGGNTLPGPFNWAGVVDQYFAAVFIPDDPRTLSPSRCVTPSTFPRTQSPPRKRPPRPTCSASPSGNPERPDPGTPVRGPQELHTLETVPVPTIVGAPPDLRGLVNFGFFGVIARPLFLWLQWTYKYVGNWGWAIVDPDPDHQSGAAAAARLQHEVGAEDAEDPAADEGDQGEIQEVRHARSARARK